jgi:uncharacterized protein YbjT (DUF2867 family)
MKLIVGGATGFVAQEVIRQSLAMPQIASVVALARKPVTPPSGAGEGASKLKSVVVRDYDDYSDEVKKEFAGADACIWSVFQVIVPFSLVFRVAGLRKTPTSPRG